MENNTPLTTAREARIDKWLWASRIFKTRTMSTAACKKKQITVKGVVAKPSRLIKVGDIIEVRKAPITYSFRVLQAIERRVGPRLITEVLQDVTTPDQLELLELSRISGFINRARGTGRPTKKDRRSIETFTQEAPTFFGEFYFDDDDNDNEAEDPLYQE